MYVLTWFAICLRYMVIMLNVDTHVYDFYNHLLFWVAVRTTSVRAFF